MKKIFSVILIVLILIINTLPVFSLEISGKSMSFIVIDLDSPKIIYAMNEKVRLHVSISNKIMTALLSLEKYGLGTKATISNDAANTPGATMQLKTGDKYTVNDLIYTVLLTSSNDAAVALSENYDGSVADFVKLMNDKAASLGMTHTLFDNPTGLYSENQYTTAEDLSILLRYAMQNSTFRNMFSSKAKPVFYGTDSPTVLRNQNEMLWTYEKAEGGKIGYNTPENQSIISSANNGNLHILAIVLDCPGEYIYDDTTALLDNVFENFKRDTLIFSKDILGTARIFDTDINLLSNETVYYLRSLNAEINYEFSFSINESLKLPVTKSTPVAIGTFTLNDGTRININLYSDTEISAPVEKENKILTIIKDNREMVYVVCGLVSIEIVLLLLKLFKKKK